MDFGFTCPQCSAVLDANDEMEGMVADCPSCGTQVTVRRPATARASTTARPNPGTGKAVVLRTGRRETIRYETVTDSTGAFLVEQRFRKNQPLGEAVRLPMDQIDRVELHDGETLGEYAIRKAKAVLLFVAGMGIFTFLVVFFLGLNWYRPGRIPASVTFAGLGAEHMDSIYVPLFSRSEATTLERFLLVETSLRVFRRPDAGALGSALQVVGLLVAVLGLSFALWSAQPLREWRVLELSQDASRLGEYPHLARTLRTMGIDLFAPGAPAPAVLKGKLKLHCYIRIGIGAIAVLLGIVGGVAGKAPPWRETSLT